MRFPPAPAGAATALELAAVPGAMPRVSWLGFTRGRPSAEGHQEPAVGMPLLGEHSQGLLTRPHLRGHRVRSRDGAVAAGRDWSTRFVGQQLDVDDDALEVHAVDAKAGLAYSMRVEALPGGGLRARAALTNTGADDYALEGLEVVLPVGDHLIEVLDFTGRHERERTPQRHRLTDGLYLRESRGGRPGLGSASMLVVGTPGFDTDIGEVLGVHVAWSGNSVLRIERDAQTGATIGGGELLLPGEITLGAGASYRTPWVHFAASGDGLDGLAASWHTFQRSLPHHPTEQPVVLNVWEAVYFDHDPAHLAELADRAARAGVERFVLDDGWFHQRRDDTAGLGDWWVDESVWPDGLAPLIERVHSLGMTFGLWFEPEMVNPDSDLFRSHPDWVLATGERLPPLHRHQLVLDLTHPEVWAFLLERVDAILSSHAIDYVKWDHNRDLVDAGALRREGAPSVHAQTVAFYALLDELAARHPGVSWESCASGGGRVDFEVLERVQRFWTSDMTDALARQQIQRWTTQLIAPEYLGAHVSSPTSHTTGRTLGLDFRCATALFGSFGIEWDLSTATEADLSSLAEWSARYRRLRPLLHTGRVVRPRSSDPAVLLHGVVALEGREALLAHVQLDESAHNRGVTLRVAGLDPAARFRTRWEADPDLRAVSMAPPLDPAGPTGGREVSGAWLSEVGIHLPRRRPETVTLIHLAAEQTEVTGE